MIKLKVLRYMGVLTIMKFGVFAISAFSLLITLGWILIYCPSGREQIEYFDGEGNHNPHNFDIVHYFKHYEAKLDEEIKLAKEKIGREPVQDKKHNDAKLSEATIPFDLYNDDAFKNMIDQLHHRQLEGYEFLVESMNVSIYRRPKGKNGLFEYKLYAVLPHATPKMLTTVFLDSKYRVEWDEYVTELYYVQKNEKGPDVIYFNVDFPWPLANRDYVYARETRQIVENGKEYYTIIMHSVLKHNIPIKKGVVRVDDFHQMLAVESAPSGGSKAFIQYYDDPKGNLPSWLINWAAKTGVPGFIKNIQRACSGFADYKKRNGIQ